MGGLPRSRPRPVLPPSRFGLRRTSRAGAARLLGTRMRASMAGFVVNNNESTSALPPWRPAPWQRARLQMKRAARGGPCGCFHLRRDGARHVALMQWPGIAGAGRNSDCGFSPIPFGRGRQKNRCQESMLAWCSLFTSRGRSHAGLPTLPNLAAVVQTRECACANCHRVWPRRESGSRTVPRITARR
jgi:hypothetical protein